MNRAIKFRAWDKFNACYYYSEKHTLAEFFSRTIELADADNGIIYQQYTGLKDKNGKEIYEGDWCRAEFRDKNGIQVIQGKIIMDEYMWCIDCPKDCGDDIFSINRPHNFEIIGNIYEHPELLTK